MSRTTKSVHPPRELLRWLQSLDLAISIRNFKRDFANGFLVAEVVSRYFERDVSMHSFENGHSQSTKVNNWEQLRKLFHRIGFELRDENSYYEAMIDARQVEVIVEFMMHLYTFLTSRKVRRDVVERQAFSPGGSHYASGENEMGGSESKSDLHHQHQQQVLADELAAIKESELANARMDQGQHGMGDMTLPPKALPRTSSKVLRGQNRTVGAVAPTQQVLVKKVGVKPLNRSIMEIRASRDANHQSSSGGGGSREHSNSEYSGLAGRSSFEDMASMSASRSVNSRQLGNLRPLLENLDSIVAENVDSIKPLNATVVFVQKLTEFGAEGTDAMDVVRVMKTIGKHATQLAYGCVAEPIDFIQLQSLFKVCLNAFAIGSPVLDETLKACARIGTACSVLNPHISWHLFCDFVLEMVISRGQRYERSAGQLWKGLADVATAYSGRRPNYLNTVITQLRQVLANKLPVAFLRCIAQLCSAHCVDLRAESSLPLCLYYAKSGLVHSSPPVRALAVYILRRVVEDHGVASIMSIVPTLECLYDDVWWEVQAQLVSLAAATLRETPTLEPGVMLEGDGESGPDLLSKATVLAEGLVLAALELNSQWNVIQIGLCVLGPVAHHNPIVFQRFIELLTSLDQESVERIMYNTECESDMECSLEHLSRHSESKEEKEGVASEVAEGKHEHGEDSGAVSSVPSVLSECRPGPVAMRVLANTQLEYGDLRSPIRAWDAPVAAVGICEALAQNRATADGGVEAVPFDAVGISLIAATLAGVRGTANTSGDHGSAVTWEEVYDRVSDSVVFALREESTVRGAIDILLVFARDTGVGLRVLQHPAWPQVLNEVMGPHAIPECAQVVSLAMQELQAYGAPWRNALRALLQELSERFVEVEESTYIQNLREHVDEMRM